MISGSSAQRESIRSSARTSVNDEPAPAVNRFVPTTATLRTPCSAARAATATGPLPLGDSARRGLPSPVRKAWTRRHAGRGRRAFPGKGRRPELNSAPRTIPAQARPPAAPEPGEQCRPTRSTTGSTIAATWASAADSIRMASSSAPFWRAKTSAEPSMPTIGLSTSQAIVRRAEASRGCRPAVSTAASDSSRMPAGSIASPPASTSLMPSAASIPAPPSVVAEPPRPTVMSSNPSSSNAAMAIPTPKLDAVSARCGLSRNPAMPQMVATSTTARFPATATVVVPACPHASTTGNRRAFHPDRSAASTLPSPPSAIASGTHRSRIPRSAHPRAIDSTTSAAVRLP